MERAAPPIPLIIWRPEITSRPEIICYPEIICHPERSEGSAVRRTMHIPRFAHDSLLCFSAANRFFAHGELLHQVFAHPVASPRRVTDGDHAISADFDFRFDDVLFP